MDANKDGNFAMDLQKSFTYDAELERVLRQKFSTASLIEKADAVDDKKGTDWWVIMSDGQRLSIDAKIRQVDYGPDLLLESWSICGERIGWALDRSKRTDFVCWYWADTGRSYVVRFRELVRAFAAHKAEWLRRFKVLHPSTVGYGGRWYRGEVVIVPIRELEKAMCGLSVDPVPFVAAGDVLSSGLI